MLRVHEVFPSLQGEGPDAGMPATFVRLQGCNLKCRWCDTKYALVEGGEEKTNEDLLDEVVVKSRSKYTIITGGEPLLQLERLSNFVKGLLALRHMIAIETNGTLPPPSWWKDVVWDIDYKCPSAGVSIPFDYSWLGSGPRNRIKFVVADEFDLTHVGNILPRFTGPAKPELVVSPMLPADFNANPGEDGVCMSTVWAKVVWNFCVANNLRFSLQVHKVIWGAKRGV